jgi:hypothetical protein
VAFFPTKSFERYQGVISVLLVLNPASAFAQDIAPEAFTDLEDKYIFGFTEGSDIGPEGEACNRIRQPFRLSKTPGFSTRPKSRGTLDLRTGREPRRSV